MPKTWGAKCSRGCLHWQQECASGAVSVGYVRLALLQFTTEILAGTATGLRARALRNLKDELDLQTKVLIVDWSGIAHASDDSLSALDQILQEVPAIINIAVDPAIQGSLSSRTTGLRGKSIAAHPALHNMWRDFPFGARDSSKESRTTEDDNTEDDKTENECRIIRPTAHDPIVQEVVDSLSSGPESLSNVLQAIEDHVLRDAIANCFVKKGQYLRSTPLWANGYFDAQQIIGDPNVFGWIAFSMARRIRNILSSESQRDKAQPADARLLACTQNGAALAMAATHMISRDITAGDNDVKLNVDVIDRFGPSQKFIEEYASDEWSTPAYYIFVGDFVIAGTELKIAEVHSYHRQTLLKHAVVIGSVLDHRSSEDGDRPAKQLLHRVKTHSVIHVADLKDKKGEAISPTYRFPKGDK